MAGQNGPYTLTLKIGVAHFRTSDKWRAGTRVGDTSIFGSAESDPVSATQALLLKLGSGHENTDVLIESELAGTSFFGLLSDGEDG